mmetsp:Transcript_64453/g.119906  ORF Transcript_64453/g.119906 Transcript_64453/m.119906 type:complete len:317 (-) Transcript_64453:64-1014(-)
MQGWAAFFSAVDNGVVISLLSFCDAATVVTLAAGSASLSASLDTHEDNIVQRVAAMRLGATCAREALAACMASTETLVAADEDGEYDADCLEDPLGFAAAACSKPRTSATLSCSNTALHVLRAMAGSQAMAVVLQLVLSMPGDQDVLSSNFLDALFAAEVQRLKAFDRRGQAMPCLTSIAADHALTAIVSSPEHGEKLLKAAAASIREAEDLLDMQYGDRLEKGSYSFAAQRRSAAEFLRQRRKSAYHHPVGGTKLAEKSFAERTFDRAVESLDGMIRGLYDEGFDLTCHGLLRAPLPYSHWWLRLPPANLSMNYF